MAIGNARRLGAVNNRGDEVITALLYYVGLGLLAAGLGLAYASWHPVLIALGIGFLLHAYFIAATTIK